MKRSVYLSGPQAMPDVQDAIEDFVLDTLQTAYEVHVVPVGFILHS